MLSTNVKNSTIMIIAIIDKNKKYFFGDKTPYVEAKLILSLHNVKLFSHNNFM